MTGKAKATTDMKKHILVISQYFYPEQFRINDLCTEWVKRGYVVTVLTGIPNYPEGKYYPGYNLCKKRRELHHGVQIRRIPLISRGKGSLRLAMNYFSFVVSGFFWQTFTRVKADYVFIFEVSPMTQALPGVWFAKRRKIPCYLYVQDLWPENVEIITGIQNKRIIGAIGKMVDYIYKRCDKILVTSESFAQAIRKRNLDISRIMLWPQFAEDFYQPQTKREAPEIPQDDTFKIVFAGNIGYAQGLDILPKAADLIKRSDEDTRIRFVIIGDGRYKDELVREIASYGVEDLFRIVGKQPAERIPELLAACQAAFLSLSDSPLFKMTIPAKLQTYLACGVPIIAAADGETRMIIQTANAGLCGHAGDARELAENMMEMASMSKDSLNKMGANGRVYYNSHFDKQMLLDQIDLLFQ